MYVCTYVYVCTQPKCCYTQLRTYVCLSQHIWMKGGKEGRREGGKEGRREYESAGLMYGFAIQSEWNLS